MTYIILFILGLIIGSFLNVVALRFIDGQRLLAVKIIGGRSRCMTCQVNLKWYELVPLFSFLAQGAKCRHCRHSLNWQYPAVELVTAILTAVIPMMLFTHTGAQQLMVRHESLLPFYIVVALWLIATYTLITIAAIDLRLRIIPDQSNIVLGIIGIILLVFKITSFGGLLYPGFTGPYGTIFGSPTSPLLSSLFGAAFALMLFGGIILLTRGRGMGLGDLKLAVPLGIILGWPDTLIATMAAFVIGSIVGLLMIAQKKTTLKALMPFGPFIVIGFFVAVFYGESILRWYFSLI